MCWWTSSTSWPAAASTASPCARTSGWRTPSGRWGPSAAPTSRPWTSPSRSSAAASGNGPGPARRPRPTPEPHQGLSPARACSRLRRGLSPPLLLPLAVGRAGPLALAQHHPGGAEATVGGLGRDEGLHLRELRKPLGQVGAQHVGRAVDG